MTLLNISIAAGFASAAAWLTSAILSFKTGGSYYGGPPKHIQRLDRFSKFLNAGGALLAAVSLAAQTTANLPN